MEQDVERLGCFCHGVSPPLGNIRNSFCLDWFQPRGLLDARRWRAAPGSSPARRSTAKREPLDAGDMPRPSTCPAAPGPLPVVPSAARPPMPARWRAAPSIELGEPGEALRRNRCHCSRRSVRCRPRVAPATMAAQALGWVDESTKALIPPVHPSTTFIRDPDNQYRTGYSYGRPTNPTFVQPEALLTKLERASVVPESLVVYFDSAKRTAPLTFWNGGG
jgi:hypothetical protein